MARTSGVAADRAHDDLSAAIAMRAEQAIEGAIDLSCQAGCPPRLAGAMRHAVFPGGARLRPRLVLSCALACGDAQPELADAAAVAVELIHSASLAHDDLPCFDNAEVRRGRPSVHAAFGQTSALLAGDALIVHAFEAIARGAIFAGAPESTASMIGVLAQAAGATRGLVAGQAWESEPAVSIADYHRAKTATLFEASAMLGALAGGGEPEPWGIFGELVGRAYQLADDLHDTIGDPASLGKPVGVDAARGRPNAVARRGLPRARADLRTMLRDAASAVPRSHGSAVVHQWLDALARRALV